MLLFVCCKEKTEKTENPIINNETEKQTDYILDNSLSLNDHSEYKGYFPDSGFVSTPEIAFQIAEAVLYQIYGKELIEEQKPFSINLENDIWLIDGYLPPGMKGGTAYIEISKKTGEILKVLHTK